MQNTPKDRGRQHRHQEPTPLDANPHQCHWNKTTPFRCQMLGTRGFAMVDEHGVLREAWYCALHRERSEGQHSDVLDDYSVFLVWLSEVNHSNPHTQWNDIPDRIWNRLHGREATMARMANCEQTDLPPPTGRRVTRAEKLEIAAKLTPKGRAFLRSALPDLMAAIPLTDDERIAAYTSEHRYRRQSREPGEDDR